MAFAGSRGRTHDARTHDEGGADAHDARARGAPDEPRVRPVRAAGDDGGDYDDASGEPASPARARGRPYVRRPDLDVDWGQAGTFGAGIAIGALLGASVALLLAPASGPTTRRRLGRASHRARVRATDAWADLGEELRHATFRTRRKLRRRVDEKLGRDDSLLGSLRRRRERRAEREAPERERRRTPWSRGERDTVAVEL